MRVRHLGQSEDVPPCGGEGNERVGYWEKATLEAVWWEESLMSSFTRALSRRRENMIMGLSFDHFWNTSSVETEVMNVVRGLLFPPQPHVKPHQHPDTVEPKREEKISPKSPQSAHSLKTTDG